MSEFYKQENDINFAQQQIYLQPPSLTHSSWQEQQILLSEKENDSKGVLQPLVESRNTNWMKPISGVNKLTQESCFSIKQQYLAQKVSTMPCDENRGKGGNRKQLRGRSQTSTKETLEDTYSVPTLQDMEREEELSMLKAKRLADQIEIEYLKKELESLNMLRMNGSNERIEEYHNDEEVTIRRVSSQTDLIDIKEFESDVSNNEEIGELYTSLIVKRIIENNCHELKLLDLETSFQIQKEEFLKEKSAKDKAILALERKLTVQHMYSMSLDAGKKNLVSKIAELELKLEAQTKKYSELILKFQQDIVKLQDKLEFKEYELGQSNEKKNMYQSKLKEFSDIHYEFKRRLEEKDKQLDYLKEQISEPIENINMVFSIVSNYKQTLARFDKEVSLLIEGRTKEEKWKSEIDSKNQQLILLLKLHQQQKEHISALLLENSQYIQLIHQLSPDHFKSSAPPQHYSIPQEEQVIEKGEHDEQVQKEQELREEVHLSNQQLIQQSYNLIDNLSNQDVDIAFISESNNQFICVTEVPQEMQISAGNKDNNDQIHISNEQSAQIDIHSTCVVEEEVQRTTQSINDNQTE